MKSKNLQSNYYTTQEQSKKLLELGLPADSADCVYELKQVGTKMIMSNIPDIIPNTMKLTWNDKRIPCWSVGKLQEIFDICNEDYIERSMSYRIEYMIALFELEKDNDMLNFSKLELY